MSKRQRNVSPTSGSASRTSGSASRTSGSASRTSGSMMNTGSSNNGATQSSIKSAKTAESGWSASRTSGSMMNTGSNNSGATQSSNKSAKTAESGGSVGFSNGNSNRLGQSQSSSSNYKSAASSVRNQRQRNGRTKQKLNLLGQRIMEAARKARKRTAQQSINTNAQIQAANAQRQANEKKRAMTQIQEKIKAREKEKARLSALTNEAKRRREAANAQRKANEKERAMKQIQEKIKAREKEAERQREAAKRQKVVNTPVQQFRTAAQGASAVLKKILESKKQAALTKLNKHGVPEQNKVKLSKTIMNATTSNKVNAVITLINTNFPLKNTNFPLKNNINTLSPIDLRRRAKELGFGQTVSELQQKYKGTPGLSRLREELKTFVAKTPAKRKMSAVAKTPAKRKMSAVAKTPAKRKMSAVAKTPAERKMSAVAKTPAEKKMLATKGLLKVYMDKIARGKRKLITNEIQKEVLDYIVRRNLSSGRRLAVRKISTETFINMLLIMWLDGVHDKYIDMTFKDWLIAYKAVFDPKNYESDPYFQKLQRAYFAEDKNKKLYNILDRNDNKKLNILNGAISATIAVELAETPGKRTFFAETFINNLGFNGQTFTSFSAGWEKNFKTIVLQKYIFLRKVNTIINPREYNIKSRTEGDRILLAVDQEYSGREERSLSGMISGSDSVSPLITYGQAFDPGSTMLPFGIVKDIEKIAISTRTNTGSITPTTPRFISDASYYLEDFNIDIKSNEKSVIKIDFDSGKETGNSGLKLNDLSLELNVSAGNAKKKDGVKEKIAKYFGDALQYFIASQLTKASERDRKKEIKGGGTRTYHYFLGSGDGMALFGYDFVCQKIFKNGAPNMVIDYSEGSIPIAHIINMDNTKFVLPEKKPVPSRTNFNQGSYRTQPNNKGGNNNNNVQSNPS
jgi:hypothetical protein